QWLSSRESRSGEARHKTLRPISCFRILAGLCHGCHTFAQRQVPCPRLCVGMGDLKTADRYIPDAGAKPTATSPCPRKAVGMAPKSAFRWLIEDPVSACLRAHNHRQRLSIKLSRSLSQARVKAFFEAAMEARNERFL